MAERRISFAKDKVDIVKNLQSSDEGRGPFRYVVDVLAFAAALGFKKGIKRSFKEAAKDPIRRDVFINQGYDVLINLIAVCAEDSPNILENNDEFEHRRATIFEEYANGGLEVLQEELKGELDYVDGILLLLTKERKKHEVTGGPTDITDILG